MLKHKSFVVKSGKKPKAKVMSMATKGCNTKEPKIANNQEGEQDAGHYDKNEQITLVLPQSLSFEAEDLNENSDMKNDEISFNDTKNHSQAYSLDYEEVAEENEENYSDANAYFEKENHFVHQQSTQSETEDIESNNKDKEEEVPSNEEAKAHEAVVVDSDQILDDESTREQDKKFEEDIKSILTGKKQFDKQRVAKDPEEAIKDKNHGLFDKNDNQKIEDKLKNDHAIFDKIAQSMEMASSYDLGAITMDKKFDSLEKETDKDFNKKIHDLIEEDTLKKKAVIEDAEVLDSAQKEEESVTEDDEKVETKDFLSDLDKLNTIEANHKKEVFDTLSTQSSFNSTISIKHRLLKSRIFAVSGSTAEVMIDSKWNPHGCSIIEDLNVTLTKSIAYLPDDEISTKKFRIGGADTKTWNNLQKGDYYLTFFFVNNTNPNCELAGTIEVKA